VNDRFQDQGSIRHLGMGERLVALAMADGWMNEHARPRQQNPALGSLPPATEKQRKLRKLNFLDQMGLCEATCRITFKFNQRVIQDLVLEHAKHREAA
jgi:hypothetical protein